MNFVLLPGLGGTGALFEDFIRAAPPDASCTVVSYPPGEILGYTALQDFVRRRLPATDRFNLVAESFSGPIAIAIAADPPPNLAGAVLCCTFARFPSLWLRAAKLLLPVLPFGRTRASRLAPILLNRFRAGPIGERLDRSISTVSPEVLRRRAAEALRVDVSKEVSRIAIPTLVLTAARDRLVSPTEARRLVQLNPAFRHAEIDGPHFLLQTQPAAAWSAIRSWLTPL